MTAAGRESGILYLVATPIGNVADLTFRAVEILKAVDVIACEDTRHSRLLLGHYGINRPLLALHEHNEAAYSSRLVERLEQGESIALVSDAGTPLINDPGFALVRLCQERGLKVVPVPGPCALIAALSASGLSASRFCFEGFPPRKSSARRALFESLVHERHTLIFYESVHRIEETLRDAEAVFPAERRLVIARELTKLYETIHSTTVGQALAILELQPEMRRGEFVVLIDGSPPEPESQALTAEHRRILEILLSECSVKTAVSLAVKVTGGRRDQFYRAALRLNPQDN